MMKNSEVFLVCFTSLVTLALVVTGASLDSINVASNIQRGRVFRSTNVVSNLGNEKVSSTVKTPPVATTLTPITSTVNCTEQNNQTAECISTYDKGGHSMLPEWVDKNRDILERTMYVLLVLTVIVVLYFLVKTIRLRRRKSKTRRYGVLNTSERDNLEMTPLDQDEEDEDMTVFEVNGHKK